MKTKRIRLVAAVALILLATIIGAVTSTLQAKATDPENNATSYSVADVYKAKYYSMLMAYCMSVPININNSTYLPMGDADDQLTLENAWAGVFGGDSDENWYTAKKDLFPATDTLLGSGRLQCDSKGFGEDRNEGLIAAWIDSLAKISNLPSTTAGKYALDVKKRFSQLSNQEKSAIFSLLNFVPRDENGSDKRITSSGKEDDTSPKDGGVDAQDILYALDILNGYTDKGEREDVSLVIRNLTGDQGKKSDRDYNISKAIKDVQKVARRYHADIVIDSLTDEEKYTQYYLAYSGRCSDYNDNNSYEVNDTYTYLAIKTPPESPTPKLVKETFKIPRSINNLDYSNFLNFDTFASTVQTATKKDPYTDRISCRADSSFEYNMLARNIFREKYAGQIYSECAAYYDNEFKKKQSELTSLKGRLGENLVSEQATIYTSFGVDQANVLKFTDTKTSNDYANCKMGYSLAGGGSNVDPTTRSKGPYECNKSYLKRYYDQYTAETEAVEKVSFGDLQYQQCYDHYDGNPMAITSADYVFDEQEEDFTRDYKKYKCGIELISRLSDADKESIRGDKTQLAQYNKLVSLTEIYKSFESFMEAKEDLASVSAQYNDNSAYLDSALDGLISSDIIINAAAAGRVDGRNPKLGIINQILIGINDYSDEMEMGCGADDYINASLPEDLESRTGISRNTSGYQGSELQGLAGKDDSSHGDDPFPDGESVSTCEGNALMGWILCPIIKGVTGGASWLYHSAIEGSLQMNSDELAANNTGAHQAWGYFVNFANVILIILFLFVIFSQLTGYGIDNYGIKRVLPKLIVVAILINLSFIICQLAVDVTNILGHSFESLFDSITVAKNASIGNNEILDKILGWLLGGIGLGVTIAAGVYAVKNVRSLLTGLLIPVLLAILVALIAVLFFFILLGVRRAGIIALIVVSPVAIVCYALPNTKKYFDKWFNGLKALLVVYPVCGLMLGMSRLIARLISAGNEDFISNLVAMAVLVYPFFVIPTLVSRAISTVTSLGEKISQLGRGIRKKTSDGIKNTERYKEAQERRKAAEEARRGTRRATIDARRRARTGQPDGAATQGAEAARRDAIRTLSDPNASLADRRRAQRELRRADRALAAAQWYQKSEDNYLAKQKEANETAVRAGYNEDYMATMDEAQRRAARNAFNVKISEAEQLSPEIDLDIARAQTSMHRQDERISLTKNLLEYNRRRDYDIDAATNTTRPHGTYEQVMTDALNPAVGTEFNTKMAQAENPANEVAMETAIARVNAKRRSETYQAFFDQYSNLTPADQKAQLEQLIRNQGVAGSGVDANMDDVRALADVMIKQGASDDVQEVLGAALGSANFSQGNWNAIRNSQEGYNSYIELMGKTGSISGKGYAKYLAKMQQNGHSADAITYEEWLRTGDTSGTLTGDNAQYNSFEAFVDNNYQGGDVVDKMGKNEMKFILKQTGNETLAAVAAGSKTISTLEVNALKKGAIGKTGDELRYANELIAQKKTDFIASGNTVAQFYNDLHLGPAEIGKLDLTTLLAIVGESAPGSGIPDPTNLAAFKSAIDTNLKTAQGDGRIWNNLRDERIRTYLS